MAFKQRAIIYRSVLTNQNALFCFRCSPMFSLRIAPSFHIEKYLRWRGSLISTLRSVARIPLRRIVLEMPAIYTDIVTYTIFRLFISEMYLFILNFRIIFYIFSPLSHRFGYFKAEVYEKDNF